MRKLLTIIGAVGLTASTGASVIGCQSTKKEKISEPPIKDLSQEELQAQLDVYLNKMLELQGKVKEAQKNLDFKKLEQYFNEFLENSFQCYFLRARVYLETQFALEGAKVVDLKDDEERYQLLLNNEILSQKNVKESFETSLEALKKTEIIKVKDFSLYFERFESYLTQLEAKVIDK